MEYFNELFAGQCSIFAVAEEGIEMEHLPEIG